MSDNDDLTGKEREIKKQEEEETIIPEEVMPKEVRQIMEMSMFSGRLPSPIAQKLNEGHITEIIKSGQKDDENSFTFATNGRRYTFAAFLILIALFIFLVVFLSKDNMDFLKEIIKGFIFLAAGFGSGYGYSKHKDRRS